MSNRPIGSEKLAAKGLKFTKLYLVVLIGGIPILAYFGIIKLSALELNEVGDFLAGAFGPLAIFWLVLGFFQQGHELRNSVDALNLQAKELKQSVAQQREMVGITERQLNLDIEVRREQTAAQISKELPYLQIRGGGSSSRDRQRKYSFYARNAGAACLDLLIEMEPSEELEGLSRSLGHLGENSDREFVVLSKSERVMDPQKSYRLTLTSTNIRAQKRVQVFEIGSGSPKMVSCVPELQ